MQNEGGGESARAGEDDTWSSLRSGKRGEQRAKVGGDGDEVHHSRIHFLASHVRAVRVEEGGKHIEWVSASASGPPRTSVCGGSYGCSTSSVWLRLRLMRRRLARAERRTVRTMRQRHPALILSPEIIGSASDGPVS